MKFLNQLSKLTGIIIFLSFTWYPILYSQDVQPDWKPVLKGPVSLNHALNCVVESPYGLILAGAFTNADGNPDIDYIAIWDGENLQPFATGINEWVHAVLVVGTDVFIGGGFTNVNGNHAIDYIARFDGETLHPVGDGLNSGVLDLQVDDEGVLYAAGWFTMAGSVSGTNRIAKLVDNKWVNLSTGMNGDVYTMSFLDGDLYAGGKFTSAGGNFEAPYFARWDGETWSKVGTGLNYWVLTTFSYNGKLYAGGQFDGAGSDGKGNRIAVWDGFNWSGLGSGFNSHVVGISVGPDGVYAGGYFDKAGETFCNHVAFWDGSKWNAMGDGLNSYVTSFANTNNGIYAGGYFTAAGGFNGADKVALWKGSAWVPISGNDSNITLSSGISALAESKYGLIIGTTGNYPENDISAAYLLKDGKLISLGSGINGSVKVIEVLGNDVYLGGYFSVVIGDSVVNNIVRWDGEFFHPVGNGLNEEVRSIKITSSGDLYAGGLFTNAGGDSDADYFARLTSEAEWESMGKLTPTYSVYSTSSVSSIEEFNGKLFISGAFSVENGPLNASSIAEWDGSTWQPVGPGLDGYVFSMVPFGENLYAAGSFQRSFDGKLISYLAKWNGADWSAGGYGISTYTTALYPASGGLLSGNNMVAVLRENEWYPVGKTFSGTVNALVQIDNKIYAGGSFLKYNNATVNYLVSWEGTLPDPTDVSAKGGHVKPDRLEIASVYPNPFNPRTQISWNQPKSGDVVMVVYNLLGQTVEKRNYSAIAGNNTIDLSLPTFPSGLYFVRLESGSLISDAVKLILLK